MITNQSAIMSLSTNDDMGDIYAITNDKPDHTDASLEQADQSLDYSTFNTNEESVEQVAGYIIHSIVTPTICVFGILGIILTVIVLSHKSMSTSTNCYLTGLAIADLLFLVLFASILGVSHVTFEHPGYYASNIYMSYASIFLNIFLLVSIWVRSLILGRKM